MEGEWSATTLVLYAGRRFFSKPHHYHCRCKKLSHKCIIIIITITTTTTTTTTTTIRKGGENQPASFCSLHLCFSSWSLRVLTLCYNLIQFGTQLCGLGRIRGMNTSFSCYNSAGAMWKTVWKNRLLEPVCVNSGRATMLSKRLSSHCSLLIEDACSQFLLETQSLVPTCTWVPTTLQYDAVTPKRSIH